MIHTEAWFKEAASPHVMEELRRRAIQGDAESFQRLEVETDRLRSEPTQGWLDLPKEAWQRLPYHVQPRVMLGLRGEIRRPLQPHIHSILAVLDFETRGGDYQLVAYPADHGAGNPRMNYSIMQAPLREALKRLTGFTNLTPHESGSVLEGSKRQDVPDLGAYLKGVEWGVKPRTPLSVDGVSGSIQWHAVVGWSEAPTPEAMDILKKVLR